MNYFRISYTIFRSYSYPSKSCRIHPPIPYPPDFVSSVSLSSYQIQLVLSICSWVCDHPMNMFDQQEPRPEVESTESKGEAINFQNHLLKTISVEQRSYFIYLSDRYKKTLSEKKKKKKTGCWKIFCLYRIVCMGEA